MSLFHKIIASKSVLQLFRKHRAVIEQLVDPYILYRLSQAANRTSPVPVDYSDVCVFEKREINILLVIPRFEHNEAQKKSIPIACAYLAAAVHKAIPGAQVTILDCHGLNIPDEIITQVLQNPWDIVGFSYWTAQADHAYALSAQVRKLLPKAIVVHGGVHATLMPQEAAHHADYVVCGEGEQTFAELVATVCAGTPVDKIPGVATAKSESFVAATPRALCIDLDTIAFPEWKTIPYLSRYDFPLHVVGGNRMAVIGSRGCPYSCSFCSSPLLWGRRVRYRSAVNVYEEIKQLHDQFGYSGIHFWDDNILLNAPYMEQLCELLFAGGIKISWVGLTRAEHVVKHRQLLPLLKRAGCVGIEIGVESFSDEVGEAVDKNVSVDTMSDAFSACRESGITPLYTHMLFVPGESLKSYPLKHTFLQKHRLTLHGSDTYFGQFATPHVGTGFAAEAPKLGIVLAKHNSHFYHHRINFVPFSLLHDIPGYGKHLANPARFLRQFFYMRMMHKVFDLSIKEYTSFMNQSMAILREIDGKTRLLDICTSVARKQSTTVDKVIKRCILAIIELAKTEVIVSRL